MATASLIDVARTLGPTLRAAGEEGERQRRLPGKALASLAESGLQRMFLPKSLGGHEIDPVTCARVVEELARFDPAAAWALQSNSGCWWASRLPDDGAEEIYGSNPNAIMSAAFHPPQMAIEVPGGYRVTGRAPLASNVHDSEWILLSAMVTEGGSPKMHDGVPEMISLIPRTSEVEIVDTWHTLGMRATDSNDVVMKDVFVPKSRTFQLTPTFTPGRHFKGPLYQFPAAIETQVIIAPVLLALARVAIDEFMQLATQKAPFGSMKLLRDRAVVQGSVARSEGVLRSARALFYETVEHAWKQTLEGQPLTLERKADLMLAGVHAADSAWNVVDSMHRLAGTSGIYTRSRLERCLRDALTVRHHGFVSESKYETIGQVFLGLPPEFVLVAF